MNFGLRLYVCWPTVIKPKWTGPQSCKGQWNTPHIGDSGIPRAKPNLGQVLQENARERCPPFCRHTSIENRSCPRAPGIERRRWTLQWAEDRQWKSTRLRFQSHLAAQENVCRSHSHQPKNPSEVLARAKWRPTWLACQRRGCIRCPYATPPRSYLLRWYICDGVQSGATAMGYDKSGPSKGIQTVAMASKAGATTRPIQWWGILVSAT